MCKQLNGVEKNMVKYHFYTVKASFFYIETFYCEILLYVYD